MTRFVTGTDFDPLTAVHYQETDPGVVWTKDAAPAVDVNPAAPTGGALTPNVVRMPNGGYRLYYLGFAPGVTRDDHAGHVVSASSRDGEVWTADPGVRVEVHPPHATLRTLCPDVVPMPEGGYRMYFEARVPDARIGEHDFRTAILSATSEDGLEWTPEEGVRLSGPEWTYGTPRCVYFPTEQGLLYRLYFHRYPYPLSPEPYQRTIIGSAASFDGLRFELEAGARIPQETPRESMACSAPEVIRLGDGTFRTYYAAWSEGIDGGIFTAVSDDGLEWTKSPEPLLDLDTPLDEAMMSEPCVIRLPDGRSRMFYEAKDAERNARILTATTP